MGLTAHIVFFSFTALVAGAAMTAPQLAARLAVLRRRPLQRRAAGVEHA